MSARRTSLIDVVDAIYEAGTEPGAWQRVVDGVQAFLPAAGVNLQGFQNGVPPQFLFVWQGFDPNQIREYQSDYAASNPWLPHIPQMPVGVPHVFDESPLMPEIRRSDFYSFIARCGLGSGLGLPVWTTSERLFFLVIEYPLRKGDKLNERARQLAQRLGPHLARSFAISHRLGSAGASGNDGVAALLGRTLAPVIVVDSVRRVRFANRAGETLLATSGLIQQPAAGRVVLKDTMRDCTLAEAVRCCAVGDLGHSAPVLIDIPLAETSLTILVVPLFGDASLAKGGSSGLAERLALLLFVFGGAITGDVQAIFRNAFGLTRAEAQLAAALSEGVGLAEYAAHCRLSLATVRNQLQAIFGKTSTHRQAELVALLSALKRGLPVWSAPAWRRDA